MHIVVCFALSSANNISAAKYYVAAWRWALKPDFEKKLGLACLKSERSTVIRSVAVVAAAE
jgi:hypothetical protein